MEECQPLSREFKGIFIPAPVWLSAELNIMEKVLYAEIDSLDGENGCFASNEYLADFFGISKRAIQSGISHLKELGLIQQESFNGRSRCLRVTNRFMYSDMKKTSPQTRSKLHLRHEENFTSAMKNSSPIYNNIEYSLDNTPHTPQGAVADADVLVLEAGFSNVTAKSTTKKPSPPCDPAPPSPKKDDGFDEFWAAYPKCERKTGKAGCRTAWISQGLSKVKGKLMKALEIDKASRGWAKNNGEYIPLPKTWLNKKRYEDISDEAIVTPEPATSNYAVVTIEDSKDLKRNVEFLRWFDDWLLDENTPPPEWSIRSEQWVKENKPIIKTLQKL